MNVNLVSWGTDLTLEFEWVDGDWNDTSSQLSMELQGRLGLLILEQIVAKEGNRLFQIDIN